MAQPMLAAVSRPGACLLGGSGPSLPTPGYSPEATMICQRKASGLTPAGQCLYYGAATEDGLSLSMLRVHSPWEVSENGL